MTPELAGIISAIGMVVIGAGSFLLNWRGHVKGTEAKVRAQYLQERASAFDELTSMYDRVLEERTSYRDRNDTLHQELYHLESLVLGLRADRRFLLDQLEKLGVTIKPQDLPSTSV